MSRSRSRTISRSASPAKGKASPEPVSESTCPFLIRVFVSKGKHAPMIDFDEGNFPIRDEFQAYGWKHTTPTSLIALLYPSFPPVYRSPLARYSFRHIYVDASQRGLYRNRDLVSFTGRELLATLSTSDSGLAKPSAVSMDMELDDAPDHGPSRRGAGRKVEEKTLDSYGFITGDLLSVSIHIPEPRTPAPAPPLGAARPSIVAGPAGAGAPGFGGRELLGRNGPNAARGLPPREPHPSDQDGNWSRGEALPSSNFKGRGDRRDRARDDGFANGGRADVRGSGPGGSARRRTPSPHRDRDRAERRSRSPDARRSRY